MYVILVAEEVGVEDCVLLAVERVRRSGVASFFLKKNQ